MASLFSLITFLVKYYMYRIIKITIYLKLATKSRGILLSCLAVIRIQSFDLTFFFCFFGIFYFNWNGCYIEGCNTNNVIYDDVIDVVVVVVVVGGARDFNGSFHWLIIYASSIKMLTVYEFMSDNIIRTSFM